MELARFLLQAARFERDAELVYRRSTVIAHLQGKSDAAAFFAEMAGYSRLHMEEALQRAGLGDPADLPPPEVPAGSSPEAIDMRRLDDITELDEAMLLALDAERRGLGFYESEAKGGSDADTREIVATFASEERDHVLALKRFLGLTILNVRRPQRADFRSPAKG